MSWIQTFSGFAFNPFEPDENKICIQDIAHSLAHQCRFTGHSRQFYSVAQHCVEVASRVRPEFQAHALLHDASEAYLADVSRPLKQRPEFAFYREAEAVLQAKIYQTFGLTPETPAPVKVMDKRVLLMEADLLLSRCEWSWNDPALMPLTPAGKRAGWQVLTPLAAEREFLNVYFLTVGAAAL